VVEEALGSRRKLEYVGGKITYLPALGRGLERSWQVRGTGAGLRAIVVPICQNTGSLVIWQFWAQGSAGAVQYWLSTLRPIAWREPPICAELNP
jgi:hypothetical protein